METCHRKGNILIVDDTPENLTVLRQMLTAHGYRVRPAINGETALKTIQTSLPDLILLDIMMDGLDGFEVCRRLKSDASARDIPVIFISALNDTIDKVKAFQIGGVDYITKPFQEGEVLARVETHMLLHHMHKQLKEQNVRLQHEITERKRMEAELEKSNRELARLACFDGLTQIANRRYFDHYLEKEWGRMARQKASLSLILCDIDFFKRYNDTYGHQAGDECLKKVAQTISHAIKRPADLVARYGGEEFVILLPETDLSGAVKLVEDIKLEIRNLQIEHAKSDVSPYVSLSMGICTMRPDREKLSTELVAVADRALYQAKKTGRDRVESVEMDNIQLCETGTHLEAQAISPWMISAQFQEYSGVSQPGPGKTRSGKVL
jgi:diguanylate cyclase (GGDEF)-like protein